jgi:hypothetical protein
MVSTKHCECFSSSSNLGYRTLLRKKQMKFYEYTQNNSGGSFIENEKLTHRLMIEAETCTEADEIAEDMGVYFNGCEDGDDCPCCGDRWYSGDLVEVDRDWIKEKGINDIEGYCQWMADNYSWCDPDVRLFYKDGTVKEFSKVDKDDT